jgi:hypothetical protein
VVLTVRKKHTGEVLDAVYKNKDKSVKMVIKRSTSRGAATTEIKFSENSRTALTLSIRKTSCNNLNCFGTAQISARGRGVNYQMLVDFESISKSKSKDSARVTISHNRTRQKGLLNLNTGKIVGCGRYGLMNVLNDDQIKMVETFKVPLKSISRFYEGQIKSSMLSTYSGLGTGDGLILLSFKGGVCRALCAAIFAAMATGCCGGTAGALCVVCVALAAANASLCMDLCPK